MNIMQSSEWGQFKTSVGTTAVRAGNVQYTKHKIPFSNYYYAYAPKVNPQDINWGELESSLNNEECIAINFDIPNLIKHSEAGKKAEEIFKNKKCKRSPRDTFAKSNILLDLTPPEEELLAKMHKKHRYNIRLSIKKGVTTRLAKTEEDFDIFYKLLKKTATRQKYFIHSKDYYRNVWKILGGKDIAHILIAEHEGEPLTAWMLFTYENILYYPYGGSSNEEKRLQHSMAAAWGTIKFGKEKGCHTFDMWGAADNPLDEKDGWFGFTQFKMRFGGEHITYIDSYDFVINKPVYNLFNTANDIRWKILKILK